MCDETYVDVNKDMLFKFIFQHFLYQLWVIISGYVQVIIINNVIRWVPLKKSNINKYSTEIETTQNFTSGIDQINSLLRSKAIISFRFLCVICNRSWFGNNYLERVIKI